MECTNQSKNERRCHWRNERRKRIYAYVEQEVAETGSRSRLKQPQVKEWPPQMARGKGQDRLIEERIE
ncbi:hypothetical protein K0M31_009266 [Melipona bicolor]|uniref:Uncharacterized protein n=1 Tax=Melipona bicolor TaxID=60889 RepID=A0AA40FPV6_9HYME|nr:hypothetical protein K0M31_009266 [Melipona bicolor]